jgi:hypothetical protein
MKSTFLTVDGRKDLSARNVDLSAIGKRQMVFICAGVVNLSIRLSPNYNAWNPASADIAV